MKGKTKIKITTILFIAICSSTMVFAESNSYSQDFVGFQNPSGNGGALHNTQEISQINGDFSTNSANVGGALYNTYSGKIGGITGDFTQNTTTLGAGAVANDGGSIGLIIGDFSGNNSTSQNSYVYAGALSNSGVIAGINGSFIKNYAHSIANGHANGGAIDNYNGTIGVINGDFIGNYAQSTAWGYGGAISNNYIIEGINGDFINNYVHTSGSSNGGAIDNFNAQLGFLHGNFSGNHIISDYSYGYGGAISNNSNISSIVGNFTDNYVRTTVDANGGAIDHSAGTIGVLNGNFERNYADGSHMAKGGAINNNGGTITKLEGNFSNNYATAGTTMGGAIFNDGTIGSLVGDFKENYAKSKSGSSRGGAIYNANKISSIKGDFINNRAEAPNGSHANGGAIENFDAADMDSIEGNFVGNSVISARSYGYGGAISNNSNIGSITGDFINNYVITAADSNGGAIDNFNATISSIKGNFEGNYIKGNAILHGGAINNNGGTITSLTGSFKGNYAEGKNSSGGAIYNSGEITNLKADFTENYLTGENVKGGGVANTAIITSITGDFINNNAVAAYDNDYKKLSYSLGGALYNSGNISSIDSNFNNNYVYGEYAKGGALFNSGSINSINGSFTNNKSNYKGYYYSYENATADGGAIYNENFIGDIVADFVKNSVSGMQNEGISSEGGAIYNKGTINNIIGDFIENSVSAAFASGGAISNWGHIGSIIGNFDNNYINSEWDYGRGGAIYNYGTIDQIKANFTNNKNTVGNHSTNSGGAIYNAGKIKELTGDFINNIAGSGGAIANNVDATIETLSGNFIDNKALMAGGAIANGGTVSNVINSRFINNSIDLSLFLESIEDQYSQEEFLQEFEEYGYFKGGAIYTSTDMKFTADNGVTEFTDNYITLNGKDKIDSAIYVANPDAKLTFISKNNGQTILNDNIAGKLGYTVSFDGDKTGVLNLFADIKNANVEMGGITLNTINNAVYNYNFNNFTLTNDINFVADVDLANSTMDRVTANNYGSHKGNINVVDLNILSDANKTKTEILFADKGLKDNVVDKYNESRYNAYSPIYKYNVYYENRPDAGYYVFNKSTGGMGSSYTNYNPAVLTNPVSNQASASSIVNETVKHAFHHADVFSQLPYTTRLAIMHNNKYAINGPVGTYTLDADLLQKSYWVQPFTTFERINLNNGPAVDAITYGTLFGTNSKFKELKRGWYNVQTIYGGYNGSLLNYDGIDTTVNGGVVGLTETFYKNNFFSAFTATVGGNYGSSNTRYGKEDYAQLVSGIGNKSGYNFEFKNGKYIIQPAMFMSYSFVNTFDYTNAAGIKIKSSPLHTLTLNPSIKFISNLKNGWQPYAIVGIVSNVLNINKVKANETVLPKMTVDPYVEYGIGIKRTIKDKFSGFFQAMVRNGGRNGVALTFGFKWAIGKENL